MGAVRASSETRFVARTMHCKVVAVVLFAAVGAILFGIDCSNIGAAIVKETFKRDFCVKRDWPDSSWPSAASCSPHSGKACDPVADCDDPKTQPAGFTNFVGFMTSLLQLGAAAGALLVAPFVARRGRRQCMFSGSLVTIVGIVPQCFVTGYALFLLSRFVAGVGVGMITYVLPIFISEVAPTEIRGALGVSFQFVLMCGSFMAAAVLAVDGVSYQAAFAMPAFPAVIVLLGIFSLPASPREVLVRALQPNLSDSERNRYMTWAQNSMRRLRSTEEEADDELQRLKEDIAGEVVASPWSKLWTDKSILRRVAVANMLQWFQQFSGMNCLMNYGPEIYEGAGVPISGLTANVFTTGCNLLGTVAMMFLIDRWGRRTLFLLTTSSMCLFMALSGVLALLSLKNKTDIWGWTLLVAVCLTNIAFALGWGGGAWVYPSEIFPMDIKEKALSISVFSQWFGNFCINLLSAWLIKGLSYHGTFFCFAGTNVVGFLLCYMMVKETKGKSLEEVGEIFGADSRELLPRKAVGQ